MNTAEVHRSAFEEGLTPIEVLASWCSVFVEGLAEEDMIYGGVSHEQEFDNRWRTSSAKRKGLWDPKSFIRL